LLGDDFLSHFLVQIDYQAKTVTLTERYRMRRLVEFGNRNSMSKPTERPKANKMHSLV